MKKDLTNHEKFLQAELKPQPCEMKELCYMYLILGNGLLLAIGIIIALIVPHTIANFVVGGMLAFIYLVLFATVYKGNIIKNLIMDCQSYTKYRPNETTGGIFVSWRRKEELPTGA